MSKIKNFVKYSIETKLNVNIVSEEKRKSLVLRYPCINKSVCYPYELVISPGVYKIECWGSIGEIWGSVSHPGLGAYTKGTLLITKKTPLFVYVGARGFFNAVRDTYYAWSGYSGGGATDVRLEKGETWFSKRSLISRIMVAAGGAGAEWRYSFGGNGGTLEGGTGISANNVNEASQYEEVCKGATQTQGTNCPSRPRGNNNFPAFAGEFGSAGFVESISGDYGGFGGGGYYGGTSYDASYAGSGGSSFISGHEGCNAVKDAQTIEHTGTPFHYSGFVFTDTKMIAGNETMPLPAGGEGIYNDSRGGAFRITLMMYRDITCHCSHRSSLWLVSLLLLSLSY